MQHRAVEGGTIIVGEIDQPGLGDKTT